MDGHVIGIDVGTTATKAVLLDRAQRIVAESARIEHPTFYPPGHASAAEQDPDDWWAGAVRAIREVLAASGVAPGDVAGLSVSSQAPCVVLLDRAGPAAASRPPVDGPAQRPAVRRPRWRRRGGAAPRRQRRRPLLRRAQAGLALRARAGGGRAHRAGGDGQRLRRLPPHRGGLRRHRARRAHLAGRAARGTLVGGAGRGLGGPAPLVAAHRRALGGAGPRHRRGGGRHGAARRHAGDGRPRRRHRRRPRGGDGERRRRLRDDRAVDGAERPGAVCGARPRHRRAHRRRLALDRPVLAGRHHGLHRRHPALVPRPARTRRRSRRRRSPAPRRGPPSRPRWRTRRTPSRGSTGWPPRRRPAATASSFCPTSWASARPSGTPRRAGWWWASPWPPPGPTWCAPSWRAPPTG